MSVMQYLIGMAAVMPEHIEQIFIAIAFARATDDLVKCHEAVTKALRMKALSWLVYIYI
jgi:hypothetical protein